MEFQFIVFIVAVLGSLLLISKRNKENEEADITRDRLRKLELKKLIEEQEERTVEEEYDEEEFWKLIDRIHSKSQDNYKHHLGLLSDYLNNYSVDDIVKMDNLVFRLCMESINQDLHAAATIIFQNKDLGAVFLLQSVLMIRGQVFFKQACLNPDLIIGKEFYEIDGRTISDILADAYFAKTNKLMPVLKGPEEEFVIPGEKWTDKDLPNRYNKLWMEFA